MAADTIPNTIKSFPLLGASALVGGATCILLGKPLLYMGRKVNAFIDHAMPTLKGPLNTALVIAPVNLIAVPLSKYTFSKVGSSLHEKDHRIVSYLSGMAAIILSTTLITPKLSRLISTHQVSDLSAAFYSLAGAAAFAYGASQTDGFRSDNERGIINYQKAIKEERSVYLSRELSKLKEAHAQSSYSESLLNTATHSLTNGMQTLAAGAAGLLVYKLALATSNIFQTHATPFLKSTVQAIKGPGNAAIVITGASLAATPLRDYVKKKTRKSEQHRKDKAMLTAASGVATIFLATVLFTPKLSSYISSHQVSYLGASLYGLAGGLAFTQKDNALEAIESFLEE